VRFDAFLADLKPFTNSITIKEVVLTREEAESEVARLSAINHGKECIYFWQMTRLVEGPTAPKVNGNQ
jgi:hypothetical protein